MNYEDWNWLIKGWFSYVNGMMGGVRYGKLPWKRLFEPSIQLAEQGFEVTPLLETRLLVHPTLLLLTSVLGKKTVKEKVLENEEFKRIFAPNGKLLKKGDICYRRHYASTLRKVAEGGADAFYQVSPPFFFLITNARLLSG